MAKDRLRNLENHGGQYRFVKYIDGKSVRIPLNTSDKAKAIAARDRILDQMASPADDFSMVRTMREEMIKHRPEEADEMLRAFGLCRDAPIKIQRPPP
jgi:hypothetical protein